MKNKMDKLEKEAALREKYYSPETGFRSAQHIWELAKEKYPSINISKYFVKQWLLSQSTYTRFKKWNNPKHYRHTFVRDFDQLQMDLIILEKYADENRGYQDILVAIEILSRFAFAVPLKSKYGTEVKPAIERVLGQFEERFPNKNVKFVQFDEGSEFLNKDVIPFLKSRDITYFSAPSPRKAAVIERFNRTRKTKLMKMYEKNGKNNWVDYLESFIKNYNDSFHRGIGMKPKDVNEENKFTVWGRLFGHIINIKKPKYKVGDKVRVLKLTVQYRGAAQLRSGFRGGPAKYRDESKMTFGDKFREKYKDHDPEKVATTSKAVGTKRPPFSVEILEITDVLLGDPNVYKLKSDEFKRNVEGIFYEEELSLVKE